MPKSRLISLIALALILVMILLASTATVSGSTGNGSSIHFLTQAVQGDPLDIALGYVFSRSDSLGLQDDDLTDMDVIDQYTSSTSGITHIYFQQRYAGIDVYNALMNVNIAAGGSVVNVGNRFVSGLAEAVNTTKPVISPSEAVQSAAQSLELSLTKPLTVQAVDAVMEGSSVLSDGGISLEPIPVKLTYQPMEGGAVRLAWDLSIYELDAQNYWSVRIDAVTGRELDRANLVVHDNFGPPADNGIEDVALDSDQALAENNLQLAGDHYRVYAEPLESPSHGGRTLVTDPADSTASPYGWHDTDGAAGAEYTITQGNNVHAYEDGNNPGFSPDGTSDLNFDFTIDLGQQPDSYEAAAVTNLFYWNNLVHDVFYHYGFDEVSGNFQENNYGLGGAGSDSVNAEAQDGGGINNANFLTLADGSNPRMQMYLWNYTTLMRDGDLDNGIIAHEYGHGISNRLTGGPSTVSCLDNVEQPGEGWSDYIALIMTIESDDSGADRRGIGTYALGQATTGTGIRDYPYSTNMAIDPRTYDDIKTAVVPHGVGSVWAAMLWDVTWDLIDLYGFYPDLITSTGGNNIALQLVVDGMKLQPCSPGFIDARDAILLADQNNNSGANQCLIWEAFARRGLGYGADQGSSGSRSDGTEAFDLPPVCTQTLKITKTANTSPVDAGANLTYSMLVENDTLGTLTGVTITDNVPAETTYVGGSATCDGTESDGVVTFPIGDLGSSLTKTCFFQVMVGSSLGTATLFSDDMESGNGKWTVAHGSGTFDWSLGTANPNSTTQAWFAEDVATVSDQYLVMTNPVILTGTPVLKFWHDYNSENIYDGGVVEISVEGGQWTDLGSLMTQNGYNGTISTLYDNPIGGRQAFSGDSGGYVETIVDLNSYAGSSVQIRFRLATDSSLSDEGWYVDDVTIVDEDWVTNTACVSANGGDYACDTVVTFVNPAPGDPQITASPASLSAVQGSDETTIENLTIGNSGTGDLSWTITESSDNCENAADIPWLSAAPIGGLTVPGGSEDVTVTFDSADLTPDDYAGSLCFNRNDSDEGMVEVPIDLTVEGASAFVDQIATADLPDGGTVSGTSAATQNDDGYPQSITERKSGGKPSNRYDYLGHTWSFQLAAGSGHTFYVNAWQEKLADADNFVFAYSTDNSDFVDMDSIAIVSDDVNTMLSYVLPASLSGTVYVRVSDTDQTTGIIDLDTVNIDHMYIRTSDPGQPPPSIAMHVQEISGTSATALRNKWSATAQVTIYETIPPNENPVEGALVTGTWSGAASGDGSCITDANGRCDVTKSNIKYNKGPVTFTITDVVRGNDTYNPDVISSVEISPPTL